ncbi:hypothetical protein ACOSP7_016755 [Xanthoceras sorbifolium]
MVMVDGIPEGVVRSEGPKDLGKETEVLISDCGILPAGLSPASRLTESDLLRIIFQYGIPESVELRLPRSTDRADSVDRDWTCFYELPFRQGFRFPIPALSR